MTTFRAWRVHENNGTFAGQIEEQSTADLPAGDVLIRVSHSSLNFKDALSAAGNKGVTRDYPHTPGIDAVGEIVESSNSIYRQGQKVIVTGYDLGMNTSGGFGGYIRVPADWCVPLPESWSERDAMIYGTAGLTAGLCVDRILRNGVAPGSGPVLVTGASGGVGTLSVELLAKLGFEVVAVSGKPAESQRLEALGASRVMSRDQLQFSEKPLMKSFWAAAVDTVGGECLGTLLKQMQPEGVVAACGMAGGTGFQATVLPFILRGVILAGVDSVEIPQESKARIWQKLSTEWRCPKTEQNARTIGLNELQPELDRFLEGRAAGRVVLTHDH